MKHVASLFSGSHGLRPGVLLPALVTVSLLIALALISGCSDDEGSSTFPPPIPQETKHWLFGIGGTDATNIYVCGRLGSMFHYDGTSWSDVDMGVNSDIVDIQNVDGVLYAVGHNGKIWKNTGSSWSSMDSGTSQHLFGFGKYQGETYACGFGGTLLRLSGNSWSSVGGSIVLRDPNFAAIDTMRMDRDIFSLVTIGNNFIGGAFLDPTWEGPAFGIDGTKGMILSKDSPPEEEENSNFDWWLRPLSGAELIDAEWVVSSTTDSETPSRNFLATSEGFLFRLLVDGDGNDNWIKDNLRVTHDRGRGISDMYLTPDNVLYMVTDDGLVVAREDDGTTTELFKQGVALTGIWGTGSDNLFIVGYMEDEFYHAVHHAGTDTLEITKIDWPVTLSKSLETGIDLDEYNRPICR